MPDGIIPLGLLRTGRTGVPASAHPTSLEVDIERAGVVLKNRNFSICKGALGKGAHWQVHWHAGAAVGSVCSIAFRNLSIMYNQYPESVDVLCALHDCAQGISPLRV